MIFKRHSILACAMLATLAAPTYAADADEIRSTLQDQQEVAVTIYNGNLALSKISARSNSKVA